jgi:hypothetical protein
LPYEQETSVWFLCFFFHRNYYPRFLVYTQVWISTLLKLLKDLKGRDHLEDLKWVGLCGLDLSGSGTVLSRWREVVKILDFKCMYISINQQFTVEHSCYWEVKSRSSCQDSPPPQRFITTRACPTGPNSEWDAFIEANVRNRREDCYEGNCVENLVSNWFFLCRVFYCVSVCDSSVTKVVRLYYYIFCSL